jgi:uncharacterized cupredoxin-like copper-binding protein
MSRMPRSPTAAVLGLALAAAPAAAADWSQAQPVTVTTAEYAFSPNHLRFKRGVAYRLHIDNSRGKEMHEFTAPDFFKSVEIRDPSVLNRDKTEIEIPSGTAKDFYFVPQHPGTYKLRCSDHDWAGMTGQITVE